MESILLVALALFAATNVDRLVVLVAFLIDDDYHAVEVLIGHVVGFAAALVVAVAGAVLASTELQLWAPLLGLVPIGLGLRGLAVGLGERDSGVDIESADLGSADLEGLDQREIEGLDQRPTRKRSDVSRIPSGSLRRVGVVFATAVGLDGDNVAVYVPLFVGLSTTELTAVVAIYTVAAGGTFLVALAIARRTVAFGPPDWVDRFLVPVSLILVGTYVVLSALFA